MLLSLVEIQPLQLTGSFCLCSSRRDVQSCLEEYPALPWMTPLHALNDYALLKKLSVSCIKKAANHQDVFCHLVFPPHPKARECLAMSWGASLPGWEQGACMRSCWHWCRKFSSYCTVQRSQQKKSICTDQLCSYYKIFCTSKVFWGKRVAK